MRRRLRVLVDVDDVLCDFTGHYVDQVNRLTGRDYNRDQVTEWNMARALGLEPWVCREMDETLSRPNVAHRLPPYEEAITAVRVLSRSVDIVFVTAPLKISKTWAHDRTEWLASKFSDARVIHTEHKECVAGDVLIDDKPDNVQKWSNAHPNGLPILWDRPFNRGWEPPTPIQRMGSWAEITAAVAQLSERLPRP